MKGKKKNGAKRQATDGNGQGAGFPKGAELELFIEDMGTEGEGIGKKDGFIFFVKDAVVGDHILAKAMKMKKNYGYARLVEVLEPSPYRVCPPCTFHRQCGGCQIQALDYRQQLKFKEDKVINNLKRIGGFLLLEDIPVVHPIIGMDDPYFYRNKAQVPIGMDKDGKVVAGFYAAHTHVIIPNRKCLLGAEGNERILDSVVSFMEEYKVPAYREGDGTGLVRHVLIRTGFSTGEIMVCLVINGGSLPYAEKLVEKLRMIKGVASILLNRNERNTNTILGEETATLWGQPFITDTIGNIKYQISPLSFYQVNPVQTKKLYEAALEFAGLTGKETVWDLYCGIGTISLFLAQKAKQVYGVEVVASAIADARRNAELNRIENVEFFVGKAEEVLPEFYVKGKMEPSANAKEAGGYGGSADGMLHPDVIVVDPPRKGCDPKCLETIVKMQPERVVYVSCDSATLARDLKYLCGEGYGVQKVQMVDMFPHTVHVETVVQLSQQKPDDVIEVDLDLDELDITASETKATYQEIKEYVLEKYGFKVSTLYVAQVKQKCGLDMRLNYNLPKSENARKPKCPKDKEDAIMDALKHFKMI